MRLERLCELVLAYDDPPTVVAGVIYGRGSGSVEGARLQGRAEWTNWAPLRSDGVALPRLSGRIATDAPDPVLFTLRGYAVPRGEATRSSIYATTFAASEGTYAWLNTIFAVAEAAPDGSAAGVLRVRVWECVNELFEHSH